MSALKMLVTGIVFAALVSGLSKCASAQCGVGHTSAQCGVGNAGCASAQSYTAYQGSCYSTRGPGLFARMHANKAARRATRRATRASACYSASYMQQTSYRTVAYTTQTVTIEVVPTPQVGITLPGPSKTTPSTQAVPFAPSKEFPINTNAPLSPPTPPNVRSPGVYYDSFPTRDRIIG